MTLPLKTAAVAIVTGTDGSAGTRQGSTRLPLRLAAKAPPQGCAIRAAR